MLAAPTTADLATFTGRPAGTFGGFADEALAQATLLFTILTKRADYPDDPDLAQLARNAILEMADRLLLEQPFDIVRALPTQSESIGSYSYTRATPTANKAQQGLKTGLLWWDLAVDELSFPDVSLVSSTSIRAEIDGLRATPYGTELVNPGFEADHPPYIRMS